MLQLLHSMRVCIQITWRFYHGVQQALIKATPYSLELLSVNGAIEPLCIT